MARYFVTGASGLVGRRLVHALLARGNQVQALTRDVDHAKRLLIRGVEFVEGNPAEPGLWTKALDGAAGVVHLAGESIFGKRWNEGQKAMLWSSRVDSAATIAHAVRAASSPPPVVVGASAVGYYGVRRDEVVGEEAAPGTDFLARLAVAWEAALADAEPVSRVVQLRFGIVLDPDGGALATMARPFKWGLGGPVGDGTQGVSWIHHADLTRLILKALDDSRLAGAVNATAPHPASNGDLSRALARRLRRPCLVRVPKLALRAAFGEVGDVMAGGQRAVPAKALAAGFEFQFRDLKDALADLLPF